MKAVGKTARWNAFKNMLVSKKKSVFRSLMHSELSIPQHVMLNIISVKKLSHKKQ